MRKPLSAIKSAIKLLNDPAIVSRAEPRKSAVAYHQECLTDVYDLVSALQASPDVKVAELLGTWGRS